MQDESSYHLTPDCRFPDVCRRPDRLVLTVVDAIRHKASDRPSGGGGISSMVGAAMLEADRLLAGLLIEHQIETENPVLNAKATTASDSAALVCLIDELLRSAIPNPPAHFFGSL